MRLGPKEVPAPTLVLIALAAAITVGLIIGGGTSAAAFSPFNPGWEGLAALNDIADETGVDRETITDAEAYADLSGDGTIAVIIDPGTYSEQEITAIAGFLDRGGTVVIATREPATGGELLSALGSDIAVDGDPLRDDHEYDPTPDFPRVTTVANNSVAENAEGMTLNHGTALTVEGDARPVANSSGYSYLDRTGDGAPGDDNELGARPVVAVDEVGSGTVIAVSDPSVFINAMLERDANRALAAGILAEGQVVVIDRSAGDIPPLASLVLAIRGSPVLAVGVITALVGGLVAWERGHLHRFVERAKQAY